MSLPNYSENLLLAWMLTTGSATRPTAWYVALHTADPTETGAVGEVVVGTDSAYVRKAITMGAPSGGQSLSTSQVSWTVNSGSAGYTVTHASIWDAVSSGNCLFSGALAVPRALVASGVLTFEIGEVVAALE